MDQGSGWRSVVGRFSRVAVVGAAVLGLATLPGFAEGQLVQAPEPAVSDGLLHAIPLGRPGTTARRRRTEC